MNNNYLHLNIYAFSSGVCPYPSKFTALFSHFENFHSGLYQTANFSCQIDYTLGPTNLFSQEHAKCKLQRREKKKIQIQSVYLH